MIELTRQGGQAGRLERLARVLWMLLVAAAVGRAALYYLPRQQGAYPVFADGGRHWLHGESLYDGQDPNSLCVFRYSPLVAAALTPLAFAPDPAGSALLRAANLALFLPGFWWWTRSALARREHRAAAWLLCAGMSCVTLMDVQLNLITIGFILITLAAVAESRWNTAALAVSLACCLKVYPAALALVLAVVYPRRFAWRWAAAMILCLLLPFLFQRPAYVAHQYADWLRWGLNGRYRPELDVSFQDMMRVWRRWVGPMVRETYVRLEVVAGAAVAAVCLWRRRAGASPADLPHCVAGLCCGWMMAFGPATEPQTYVQLAPVAALFTVLAWAAPRPAWFRAAVTASCVLLTLGQLQLVLPLGRAPQDMTAQPVAALLLMAAAAGYGARRAGGAGGRPVVARSGDRATTGRDRATTGRSPALAAGARPNTERRPPDSAFLPARPLATIGRPSPPTRRSEHGG